MTIQHIISNPSILSFMDFDPKERERLIYETVLILDKVVKNTGLSKYNDPSNSFSEVFATLLNLAEVELVPDDAEEAEDLYLYNVMTSKNDFNLLVFEYMRKKFDKLKLTTEDYDYIANY